MKILFRILSKLYSYRTCESMIRLFRWIRSYWLIPQFKQCGSGTRFEKIGLLKGAEYIRIGNYSYFSSGIYFTAWKRPNNSRTYHR